MSTHNNKVSNPYKRQKNQLKNIIKHDTSIGIEHYLRILLSSIQFVTLGLLVKYITGLLGGFRLRKVGTDVYMLINLFFPAVVIYFNWYNSLFICVLLGILLTETFLYLMALVFLDDVIASTASFKRNFIGIICNYIQSVMTFAVFYLHNGLTRLHQSRLSSIYYSLSTQSTLGYGDIHPDVGDTANMVCVIIQTFVGILFIVLFFARNISHFGEKTFMQKRKQQPTKQSR